MTALPSSKHQQLPDTFQLSQTSLLSPAHIQSEASSNHQMKLVKVYRAKTIHFKPENAEFLRYSFHFHNCYYTAAFVLHNVFMYFQTGDWLYIGKYQLIIYDQSIMYIHGSLIKPNSYSMSRSSRYDRDSCYTLSFIMLTIYHTSTRNVQKTADWFKRQR